MACSCGTGCTWGCSVGCGGSCAIGCANPFFVITMAPAMGWGILGAAGSIAVIADVDIALGC